MPAFVRQLLLNHGLTGRDEDGESELPPIEPVTQKRKAIDGREASFYLNLNGLSVEKPTESGSRRSLIDDIT